MTEPTQDSHNSPAPEHSPARGVKWAGDTATFVPSREHVLGGAVMFLITLVFAGFKLSWFFWVPLLPLAFIAWVLYEKTVVGPEGIAARTVLHGKNATSWENFNSLQFSRGGKAYASTTTGKRFVLPGVSFNSLTPLSEASGGRIPDPVTAGRQQADQKVQVVHRDGYAVLMDEDEFATYKQQRQAEVQADKQPKPTDHGPQESAATDNGVNTDVKEEG